MILIVSLFDELEDGDWEINILVGFVDFAADMDKLIERSGATVERH